MEPRHWSDYHSYESRNDQGADLESDLEGERYARTAAVIDRMREYPMLANMDRQLALKLARTLLIYTDTQAAWERYRSISPSVQDQVLALRGLDFATFASLHNDVQAIDVAEYDSDSRRATIGCIDANEISRLETDRTLEQLQDSGLEVMLEPGLRSDLRNFVHNTPLEDYRRRLPLLELFKNDKRAIINGLPDSKVSLVVHDSFDHMWGFDFAERTGLSEKYNEFFESVGDPASSDMYNRQSELLATVLFGYRIFKDTDNSFEPTFDIEKVRRVLRAQRNHHTEEFSANQADALNLLEGLTNPHEISLIGYSVSNIHDEVVEQRRKHGRVKLVDPETGQVDRVLRTLEPEYIAFVVEMLHQLFQHEGELKHDLLAIHALTEKYLYSMSVLESGEAVSPLHITLDEIKQCDPLNEDIREVGQADWLSENLGALANKYRLHGRPKGFD